MTLIFQYQGTSPLPPCCHGISCNSEQLSLSQYHGEPRPQKREWFRGLSCTKSIPCFGRRTLPSQSTESICTSCQAHPTVAGWGATLVHCPRFPNVQATNLKCTKFLLAVQFMAPDNSTKTAKLCNEWECRFFWMKFSLSTFVLQGMQKLASLIEEEWQESGFKPSQWKAFSKKTKTAVETCSSLRLVLFEPKLVFSRSTCFENEGWFYLSETTKQRMSCLALLFRCFCLTTTIDENGCFMSSHDVLETYCKLLFSGWSVLKWILVSWSFVKDKEEKKSLEITCLFGWHTCGFQ